MPALSKPERLVNERIDNDLRDHVVTQISANGMYRHWRCQKPGTWNMGFDIVTWPGSLCYTGDMGDYLFQRTNDMVEFMQSACMSYGYAAEKCVAHDGRLKEFSEERFEEVLKDRLEESKESGGTFRVMRRGKWEDESVSEAIEAIRRRYSEYSIPQDAVKAMYESGLWNGADLPSCKEYTFHFLWCLHAIKWFCQKITSTDVEASNKKPAD